ncbi:MAG: hypothetical protein PVG07_12560, partial [Acidobacteriota bacterium]
PSGTVVVRSRQRRGASEREIFDAVRALGAEYGTAVRAVGTGLADAVNNPGGEPRGEGVSALGTGSAIAARPTEIALLAGTPVHPYSFGWAWYTLDRQYRLPVTVLQVDAVAGTSIADFDTLVVPDLFSAGALADELGEGGRERLGRWVQDGGTLVAIAAGVDFVRTGLELTGLRSWYEEQAGPAGEDREDERPAPDGSAEPVRYTVPGAILRGAVDPKVWLTAGLRSTELPLLVDSSRILLPPAGPPSAGRRVAVAYAEAEAETGHGAERPLLLSGHAWPESLERLPGAVFAYDERVGRGRVIAFAEDVNFRGYWRGADRLFLNAVVLGPAAP